MLPYQLHLKLRVAQQQETSSSSSLSILKDLPFGIWDKESHRQHLFFVSDHDKAVIEEAQSRRKIMEDILKARGIKIVDRFVEREENKMTYDELMEEIGGITKKSK